MEISQVFGFLIALSAIIYSIVAEKRGAKNRGKDPAQAAEEKQARKHDLQNFLKSLELDMQEDEEEVNPRPIRKEKPKKLAALQRKSALINKKPPADNPAEKNRLFDQEPFVSGGEYALGAYSISQQEFHDPFGKVQGPVNLSRATEAGDYQVIGKAENARISKLLEGIPSKRQLVILQEIIGKPKGL